MSTFYGAQNVRARSTLPPLQPCHFISSVKERKQSAHGLRGGDSFQFHVNKLLYQASSTAPEEFQNGVFATQKTHHMFSVHIYKPEEFTKRMFHSSENGSNVFLPHYYAGGIHKTEVSQVRKRIKCFLSTLLCRRNSQNAGFTAQKRDQMFSVHITLEEFQNGGFTARKTHQMLSVHITLEEFQNEGFTAQNTHQFLKRVRLYINEFRPIRKIIIIIITFSVHTTPEEFQHGGFTAQKTHRMFSVHITPGEFNNTVISGNFENPAREIT